MNGRAPMRALVVDDEAPARDELTYLLRRQTAVGQVMQAADGPECLAMLTRTSFDVVFIDVRLPHLDGMALATVIANLAAPPRLVFVTAHKDYAVEAFGLAAVDYLVKPVRPERLGVTIARLTRSRDGTAPGPGSSFGDRLPVTGRGGEVKLLPVADIRAFVAQDETVRVLTPDARYHVRQPLNELEQRLHARGFLRVHRSFLVNLRHVASIETFFNGTYLLKLSGLTSDMTVPVSRRHAPQLKEAVGL